MAQAGFKAPSNGVVLDPKNVRSTQFLDVKTETNVKPGRLVMTDTTDDQVKVATGALVAIGFVGYEDTPAAFKPTTRDTAYVASDRIAVHSGHGYAVRAVLATSQTVAKGMKLGSGDSSGCLTRLVGTAADDASGSIATALESVTTTTQVGAIWVEV